MLRNSDRLLGVDEKLSAVIVAAVGTLPFNCTVSEGLRSRENAMINWGKGRTAAQCKACGIPASYAKPALGKVTWVENPFGTKHMTGRAVDVYPMIGSQLDDGKGPLGWGQFDALYHAVMLAAAKAKVRVRYGGDWDMDGVLREKGETDSPHFELA